MLKIYLAGPGVFEQDPLAHGHALKEICRKHGVEGVYPLDSHLDLSGQDKKRQARMIFEANIAFIEACDGLVADMSSFRGPGMDGGTAFEMGCAYAQAKPVVGYGAKGSYLARCQKMFGPLREENAIAYDRDGRMVEDFDLADNLMMSCAVQDHFETFEEALIRIKALCESA